MYRLLFEVFTEIIIIIILLYYYHLLSAPISTPPVPEPLTVTETQLDEASNQNGPMDAAMLPSPMEDSQLAADLAT